MKKLISVALAMLLCVGAVAMAEPSKSTADMTRVTEVKTENGVAVAADFVIAPVANNNVTAEQIAQCDAMIEDLKTTSATEYFSDLQDDAGASIDLKAVLGTDKPVVNEVMPLVVENYDASYGKMTATFTFSTPYQKNEPVVVVIRVVDPVTGKVTQVALMGKGTGVNGGIEVEFPVEVMEAIQNGNATMAVVSK